MVMYNTTVFEKKLGRMVSWYSLTSCFKFSLKKISRWIDKETVKCMLLQSISNNQRQQDSSNTYRSNVLSVNVFKQNL